jgi:hypothetical protein
MRGIQQCIIYDIIRDKLFETNDMLSSILAE